MNKNEIIDRLDRYIKLKNPDFAIMIDGKWGTGKTYFIKEYIQRCLKKNPDRKIIYVSLYGADSEKEIEKRMWIEIFRNFLPNIVGNIKEHRLAVTCIIVLFVCMLAATIRELKYEFITLILRIAGTVALISIGLWLYNIIKLFLLNKTLKNTSFIVFDDFERATLPFEKMLSYLNRYVEHLHKHVVIICNEHEICKKDSWSSGNNKSSGMKPRTNIESVPSSFLKIKEKVIGQTCLLEQTPNIVLNTIFDRGEYPLLKEIFKDKTAAKDFFLQVSHPQIDIVNYRVWQQCCLEFEHYFNGISLSYLKAPKIYKRLFPQFFSLVYAQKIHEIEEQHVFSKEEATALFVSGEKDKTLNWFDILFKTKADDRNILPSTSWESIVEQKNIDRNEIMLHWNLLLETKQPLWLQIYNYLEKTDDEMKELWEELKDAFRSRSIEDPSQIVSIYSSVLDMIANKCCPDQDMTNENAYEMAINYIFRFMDNPPKKVLKYKSNLFKSCETYGHHQVASPFFEKFETTFRAVLYGFEQEYVIPQNYNLLLSKLDLDEESFDEFWYKERMKYQPLFEYQPSSPLVDKLLSLHPKTMKERLYTIQEYFFNSATPNYTLLDFEKRLVDSFKKKIADEKNAIDYSKRYWISRVLPEFEEDIRKKEDDLVKYRNKNTSTYKEPEQ